MLFAGQFLQTPSPDGGGIVKLDWFSRYDKLPEGKPQRIVHSWDCSYKDSKRNDPSACTIWYEYGDGYYLVSAFHKKMQYPELKAKIKQVYRKNKANVVLIEDKSSGISLIQELQKEKIPVIPFKPGDRDKVSRMGAETALIEAGNVYLPYQAHWLSDYEDEISMFPAAAHDDMTDSTSQALNYMRTTNLNRFRIRTL